MVAQPRAIEPDDTREKLLAAAHRQFAERGFYGASIAQIAGEVGLTKQALLYHFKRKEDLYSEVLRRISERLMSAIREELDGNPAPEAQFESTILGIHRVAREHELDARILLREVLDNQRSSAPEEEWYFKPFLEQVVARLDKVEALASLSFSEKYARVWFLISSIEYSAIGSDTITRFYGESEAEAIEDAYLEQLRAHVRQALTPVSAQ